MTPPEAVAAEEHRCRIVVALDGSAASWSAARLALDLASQCQALLEAVFVEEPGICRMRPEAVARSSGASGALTGATDLSAEVRAFAEGVRIRFQALARSRGVEVAFRIAQGEPRSVIAEAAAVADALALGRVGWAVGRGRELGSTAAALSLLAAVRLMPLGESQDALVVVLRPDRLGLDLS